MRTIVVELIFAGAVLVALRYPIVGLLTYYWASLMNPHQILWGGTGISWTAVTAVTTLIAWVIAREPRKIPLSGSTVVLLMFLAWTTITSIFGLVWGIWPYWIEFSKVCLMALLAMAIVNSRERLHAFVWIVVISVGYWTVKGGIFVLATGANWEVYGPPAYYPNNEVARAIIMVLPLMYYLGLHSARRYVRLAMLFTVLMTVLALFGTSSRGGFIAFAAMVGFAWLRSRRKLLMIVLGATAVLTGFFVISPERIAGWSERMAVISNYDTAPTALSRFASWKFAVDVANSRPLLGGGFNIFVRNTDDPEKYGIIGTAGHNHYFQALAEHGYVGLLLFLLLGLLTFLAASRVARRARHHPDLYWARDLALLLQISLVGYFVGGITINHTYFEFYYVLIAMVVITNVLVERRIAERDTGTGVAKATGRPTPVPAGILHRPIADSGFGKPGSGEG